MGQIEEKKEAVKIALPLTHLSNFSRSLEMPLINCKVELSLMWNKNCILSTTETAATFAITNVKCYVPIVTLKTEDNAKLSKLLSKGFKRPVYWNKYKVTPNINYAANDYIREQLDVSFQGIKRLFVLIYADVNNVTTENSYRRHFLPRKTINNYIKIDRRNFFDQANNDLISQYNEVRKVSKGQGDDYKTGCLLHFAYFEKNYKLTAAYLNKQIQSNSTNYFYRPSKCSYSSILHS